MRILRLAAIAAVTVGVTFAGSHPSAAQSTTPGALHKRVFGYQDQATGAFHPVSTMAPDTTITPTTGTIELTLTITLKTALPKGGGINCGADLSASAETSASVGLWLEESYSEATVSGSTATCTVAVPYSWLIPAASRTTISGTYYVEMAKAPGTVPGASGTVRLSNGPFLSGSIPASGTTTSIAQGVTL